MRSDRLVAALLVLQARTRVTAHQLSEELEVSERTARRYLEGLSMAGIPVYSRPGRGGGWELVGGARTDLSGLTADEARALFLMAGPSAATPEIRTALRKLVQALPSTFRGEAEAAASAVVQDPAGWDQPAPDQPEYLELLQRAVIDAVQIELGYSRADGRASLRMVHPLGLVVKSQVWYLIGQTDDGQRTFRVSRVQSARITDLPAARPDDFDLSAAWHAIVTTMDARRAPVSVRVRVGPDVVDVFHYLFGTRMAEGEPGQDGRVEVEIRGHSELMVARQLAGFGERVEVVSPAGVRHHLLAIGQALVRQCG
jgi:predicted DNA-binding transcriptional regulator YafY